MGSGAGASCVPPGANLPSRSSLKGSSCCRHGGRETVQEGLFPSSSCLESCFSEVQARIRGRWATSEMVLMLVLGGLLDTCRPAVTGPLLFFTFYSCLRGLNGPGFAFMSSARLRKQAGPCLHWTSPPFAGCLSVTCQSALQANICSVVSDATSLLFAQVLTSVPWTLCLLRPHPGCSNRYQVTRAWALCSLLSCVPSFPGGGQRGGGRDNTGTQMYRPSNPSGVFATSLSLLRSAPAMPSTVVSTRRRREGADTGPVFHGPSCKC